MALKLADILKAQNTGCRRATLSHPESVAALNVLTAPVLYSLRLY